MQSKWRAPACYVGVAVLCALYLSIVPGVNLTDVCAGAGLGAAVMWAINEWETGKWNVPLPIQPAMAAFAQPVGQPVMATEAAAFQAMAPVAALAAAPVAAAPAEAAPPLPEPESRPRVDSGLGTPATMEKWEIDEKEPSWDPTALAETWAKLRAELSINRPYRTPVAPELPRTAQLARNATGNGKGLRPPAPGAKPQPHSATAKAAAPSAAKPAAYTPATYTLGSLGKAGGSPLLSRLATGAASQPPARMTANAPEPARQSPPAFLRPGTFRPR